MSIGKIVLPISLMMIGMADIQFRKQLAGMLAGEIGDPEWGKTLETVQLASGVCFIVAGITLALAFLLGFDPFQTAVLPVAANGIIV